ncbi:hypothetical protein U0070_027070, partial [Myodes glareolus]
TSTTVTLAVRIQQEDKELTSKLVLKLRMSKYLKQKFRVLRDRKMMPKIRATVKVSMAHRNNSRRLFCGTSLHILEAFQHALKRKHLETNGNELQASVDQTTEIA